MNKNIKVERCTDTECKVSIKGDEKIFFGKKGEADSGLTLKKILKEKIGAFSDIVCHWEDGEMFYEVDSYFYTVENLDNLTEDSVIESEFRQKLTEIITSLGLEVVSIEGEFYSQSQETLLEIEEEKASRWRQEMGICPICEEREKRKEEKRMNNNNITTMDDLLDVINRAKSLIGGDAPVNIITDHGILNLTINDNIIIGNDNKVNKLIIDAGDWGSPIKTMDII